MYVHLGDFGRWHSFGGGSMKIEPQSSPSSTKQSDSASEEDKSLLYQQLDEFLCSRSSQSSEKEENTSPAQDESRKSFRTACRLVSILSSMKEASSTSPFSKIDAEYYEKLRSELSKILLALSVEAREELKAKCGDFSEALLDPFHAT